MNNAQVRKFNVEPSKSRGNHLSETRTKLAPKEAKSESTGTAARPRNHSSWVCRVRGVLCKGLSSAMLMGLCARILDRVARRRAAGYNGAGPSGRDGKRSRWRMRRGMARELEAASYQLQYSAVLWEERWSEGQEMEGRINRAGAKMAAVTVGASLFRE